MPVPPKPAARPTSLIERAGFAPLPPPVLPPPRHSRHVEPVAEAAPSPLLALIHDGTERGVLDAVEAGIADALEGGSLTLVVHALPAANPAPRLLAFLQCHRPAGVVLLHPLPEREDVADLCAELGMPCTRLGPTRSHHVSAGQHAIAADERRAARDLVAWLAAQGHARIGFVSGPDHSLAAQQRELGYLDAMADAGLDRGPSLIVPGDNSFASGIEAGRLLLEISPRPTAVVASNDEMAAGLLHAASQMNVSVPEELSVVGIGDSALVSRILPRLTTMQIPWQIMGAEAVHVTIGKRPPSEMDFFAKLIQRDSVAPPS